MVATVLTVFSEIIESSRALVSSTYVTLYHPSVTCCRLTYPSVPPAHPPIHKLAPSACCYRVTPSSYSPSQQILSLLVFLRSRNLIPQDSSPPPTKLLRPYEISQR